MTFVTGFALLAWGLALSLTCLGTWLAIRSANAAPPHPDANFALFPISILKPLKGSDSGLTRNLESFFRIQYPEFELIFSVAEITDPARPVVQKLMAKYPGVKASLIIGGVQIGPNPKVNNMMKGYGRAKHDLVLISDSNVRVAPDYLTHMIGYMADDVGVITAVVAGHDAESFGGWVEAVHLNTFYARGMRLAATAGHPCVVGKSMMFRKSVAARFGGIGALARYLAEDYMAGIAMEQLGLKSVIMSDPLMQNIGEYGIRDFWNRHIRWGRIRKAQAPAAFLAELLASSFVTGAAGAFALNHLFGFPPAPVMALHLFVWSACDYLMLRRFGDAPVFATAFAWFIRECLIPAMWLTTLCGNTVLWRGRKLRVLPGGLLEAA